MIIWHVLRIKKVQSSKEFEANRMSAEIIRKVHSVEKGLSIADPRKGFGYSTIQELFSLIDNYCDVTNWMDHFEIKMALDTINEYLEYHKSVNYFDDNLKDITKKYNYIRSKVPVYQGTFGGTHTLHRIRDAVKNGNFEDILFHRHSVRDFSDKNIEKEILIEAIELANQCPSACNRQATHVYVLEKDVFYILANWLEGVGGFENDVNKYIIITGTISSYRETEAFQYIVNSAIYTAYLSLCLEWCGIGSCIIQRPVIYTSSWSRIAEQLNISKDEQVVCMLGIGIPKETYNAPYSYRMPFDDFAKFIGKKDIS